MKLAPLAGRSEDAVRDALLSHGWEGDLARSTAVGLESLSFHLTQLEEPTLQALVRSGARLGLDVITGPDWALLAGPRARLSALARPWTSPEPLVELATLLGHALPADDPLTWQVAGALIALDGPVLIGILNLTPDSFSDGGLVAAADLPGHAERLLQDGAAILDVGGESTRPGATPVDEAEEQRRVVPAIEAIVQRFPGVPVSVDTVKASVAEAALAAGAVIVNDVSALRLDPGMGEVIARAGAGAVLMHSRGSVAEMASLEHAVYPDGVQTEVARELAAALARARSAGIGPDRVVADPGLGFGKTPAQNLELLRGLGALRVLGRPLLVGPSRKRFLGQVTGRPAAERDQATAAACALAWEAGARLFRVHAPAPARDALAVAAALRPRP